MPIVTTREPSARGGGRMVTVHTYTGFLGTEAGERLYKLYSNAAGLAHRTAEATLALPTRGIGAAGAGIRNFGSMLPLGSIATSPTYLATAPANMITRYSDAWRQRQANMANMVPDIVAAVDREDFFRRINARVGFTFGSITRAGVEMATTDLAKIELQVQGAM